MSARAALVTPIESAQKARLNKQAFDKWDMEEPRLVGDEEMMSCPHQRATPEPRSPIAAGDDAPN
jgi:hypothetical protein